MSILPSTSLMADEAAAHPVAYWKNLHEKLLEQFAIVKRRNEELEERMLNVVEKVESDKAILSDEIDDLARRLAASTNRTAQLERDCARYKEDCMLAVHLLHCNPSAYVTTRKDSVEEREKTGSAVRASFALGTFPPTGVYMHEDEEGEDDDEAAQPEDPKQPMDMISALAAQTASLSSRPSFTSQFVDKIRNDNEYSCVSLQQCKSCGRAVAQLSRGTQTTVDEAPHAVLVDAPLSEPVHVLAFSLTRSDTSEEPFI